MPRKFLMLSAAIAAGSICSFASAQTHDVSKVVADANDIRWQDAPAIFPAGMKIACLYGDLAKHEPFTLRVMMPPHSVIAPHTHNLDEMLTVISGHLDHYVGPKMEASQAHTMGPGGFVHLPVNVAHALKTGDEPAIVQVSGVGPFAMTYVDPKDDPRHKS